MMNCAEKSSHHCVRLLALKLQGLPSKGAMCPPNRQTELQRLSANLQQGTVAQPDRQQPHRHLLACQRLSTQGWSAASPQYCRLSMLGYNTMRTYVSSWMRHSGSPKTRSMLRRVPCSCMVCWEALYGRATRVRMQRRVSRFSMVCLEPRYGRATPVSGQPRPSCPPHPSPLPGV